MQAEWYGREDFTLETAINSLQDKSTVLLPWFYSWPVDSPSVQGTLHGASFKASGATGHSHPAFEFPGEWPLGFRTVGCPFVDDNMTQFWANELGNNTQLGVGFMDTECAPCLRWAVWDCRLTRALVWQLEQVGPGPAVHRLRLVEQREQNPARALGDVGRAGLTLVWQSCCCLFTACAVRARLHGLHGSRRCLS